MSIIQPYILTCYKPLECIDYRLINSPIPNIYPILQAEKNILDEGTFLST